MKKRPLKYSTLVGLENRIKFAKERQALRLLSHRNANELTKEQKRRLANKAHMAE